MSDMFTNQGVVFKKTTGTYTVQTSDGDIVTCAISSRLRKHLIYPSRDKSSLPYFKVVEVKDIKTVDPVAVGDNVIFTDAADGTGLITEVLPRRSQLTRRAPERKVLEQVIVANLDQVVIVFAAAQPKPAWQLLDRYLVSAESNALPAIVVLTKLDLVKGTKDEAEIRSVAEDLITIGYKVLLTSVTDGTGIPAVQQALADKMSALVGKSGVGKTSLLNALQPELGLRVNQINVRIDKGRHTTTHLEMFPLSFGGSIVDTPGLKQFGLWETTPEDLPLLFREFVSYLDGCKFGASCAHQREPGCKVREATERGAISRRRYESYLFMRDHMTAGY